MSEFRTNQYIGFASILFIYICYELVILIRPTPNPYAARR